MRLRGWLRTTGWRMTPTAARSQGRFWELCRAQMGDASGKIVTLETEPSGNAFASTGAKWQRHGSLPGSTPSSQPNPPSQPGWTSRNQGAYRCAGLWLNGIGVSHGCGPLPSLCSLNSLLPRGSQNLTKWWGQKPPSPQEFRQAANGPEESLHPVHSVEGSSQE